MCLQFPADKLSIQNVLDIWDKTTFLVPLHTCPPFPSFSVLPLSTFGVSIVLVVYSSIL